MVAKTLSLPYAFLPALLVLSACGATGTRPQPSPDPTPPSAQVPPAPPSGAEGSIQRITSPDQVLLSGYRVEAAVGDWMLTHDNTVAVVSASGNLVDFGAKGGPDGLGYIQPNLQLALDTASDEVIEVNPVSTSILRITRAIRSYPLRLVSFVYFKGQVLQIESVAVGTKGIESAAIHQPPNPEQPPPALAVTLGERVGWGNVPTWAEGVGLIFKSGMFHGQFIARESFGVSYALCSSSGYLTSRFGEQELPGFFESALTGEQVVFVPREGESPRRTISITYSMVSAGDAAMALPCMRKGPMTSVQVPWIQTFGAKAEVVQCGSDARPLVDFAVGPEAAVQGGHGAGNFRTIELPQGCYQIRMTAPGHKNGPWFNPGSSPDQVGLPQAGRLRFKVTERGQPVPARILVRGIEGSSDPNWGTDADVGAAVNVVHAERGEGERPLPPGKYRVIIHRGFEYTAHEEVITIVIDQTVQVNADLQRVVDTTGWLSADLHLHAEPSFDAPSPLADRIRSLAAAGVEVAVATDHNRVTDYRPTIGKLGLEARIASIVGDELTTYDLRWGHFNIFPLAPDTPPLTNLGMLPSTIFANARSQKPYGKDTIIQVNHPRMGNIGYFEILKMDPDNIAGWKKSATLADLSFDALEVFNGDHYDRLSKVEACMRDWYALLNAGYRMTATGNSDSHRVSFHEPGTPRNLVLVGNDAPQNFDERAFVDAVRAGRVVVSSGIFVKLEVGGKSIGSTVPEGETEIVVRADAPPWVDIDQVELVRRGQVWQTWTVAAKEKGQPFEKRIKETLHKDDWVIAIARGAKSMDYMYRKGAKPFAFTNPVFVGN